MFGDGPAPGTRRLLLPGGGSFDLPLPGSSGKFVETTPTLSGPECSNTAGVVVSAVVGLAVGAGITWLLLRRS
jgi:hypothetical protein